MNAIMRRCLGLVFLALFLSGATVPRLPDWGEPREKRMEQLRKQVQKEKEGIRRVQKREGSVLKSLAGIEAELDRKNRELDQMNKSLDALEADLGQREEEMSGLKNRLETHQAHLKRRLRALYRLGVTPSPFLLTTPRSVGEALRFGYYLEVILANDRKMIQGIETDMAEAQRLQEKLDQRKTQAAEAKTRILAKKSEIWQEREKKRELLVGLRGEKEKRLAVLKELENAAVELQRLLDQIGKRASQFEDKTKGPGLLKGGLSLPVRGEIVATFGKKKHPEFDEYVFQKGIEIQAPIGEKILAAEAGKVVFAGRLTGYGKLMILDHGAGYFTVYAHASELLKKEAESVKRGDAIALVGDTDSIKGPYLYFEVRKDGHPQDPLSWLVRDDKGTGAVR